MSGIEAFAPGRLCLFGEHQDYLGLAVIALAIDAGIRVRIEPDRSDALTIELPDLERTREETSDRIALDGSSPPRHARDWLRSATREVVAAGIRLPGGARVTVRGDLPINAGAASSSALTVAYTRALLAFAGPEAAALCEPRRLADLAWRAEVERLGGPGGKMDPLASALGGLVHLSFGATPFVQELPAKLDGFVLIESGEPKDTTGVLATTRRDVEAALAELRAVDPGFDLAAISFDRAWSLLQEAAARAPDRRPQQEARTEELVFATLFTRDLLHAALRVLAEPELDRAHLGELLDEHHVRLRDALRLSTPRIEALRKAALGAGALGAKLNGSGGGGSLFAYAPGREAAVVAAVLELGARARTVHASRGATVTSA